MTPSIYRPRVTKRIGPPLQPLAYDSDANGANGIEIVDTSWSDNAAGNIGNAGGAVGFGGYSFNSVTIAQAAIVTYAEFALPTVSSKTGTPNLSLWIEEADNPAVFATGRRPSAVTLAIGPIDADGVTSGANSFNVTTAVQALVNRAGWASGNRINIALYDDGSASGNYIALAQNTSKAHLKIFGG